VLFSIPPLFALFSDNAYDPDVSAKQIWIDKTVINDNICLTFTDNGNGMNSEKLHKMLRWITSFAIFFLEKILASSSVIAQLIHFSHTYSTNFVKLNISEGEQYPSETMEQKDASNFHTTFSMSFYLKISSYPFCQPSHLNFFAVFVLCKLSVVPFGGPKENLIFFFFKLKITLVEVSKQEKKGDWVQTP